MKFTAISKLSFLAFFLYMFSVMAAASGGSGVEGASDPKGGQGSEVGFFAAHKWKIIIGGGIALLLACLAAFYFLFYKS